MYKERFPAHKKSQLQPWGDGLFQIFERINDNACKVDLSCEYDVNATFNIFFLFLFNIGDDLKLNYFEERGDDTD
jgi:hypothetical protein